MTRERKRVLWLLNHSTLRDCEVPLLMKLGMEVFIPKVFPKDDANLSASVSYAYDKSLSIPAKLLRQMNKFDFYSSRWPSSLRREINAHFDVAICAFFPEMISAVTEAFAGDVFLRVFGREGNLTYASLLRDQCSPLAIDRICQRDRIWLASAYSNIPTNEPDWLGKSSVHLPLGLPAKCYAGQNEWRGGKPAILFVCPRIKTSQYYHAVYKEFKTHFGEWPHIIAGVQTESVVEDPSVLGFVVDAEYQELLKTCAVMFYHSREERHLHYHPIEAIISGMPLIFMSGGMLDILAQRKLPGCCDTSDEARDKVRRILSGDQHFVDAVIDSQQILAEAFGSEEVEKSWKERFLPLVGREDAVSAKRPRSFGGVGGNGEGLKVLLWCPAPNHEGDERPPEEFVEALARQSGVGLVRLAVGEDSIWSVNTAEHSSLEIRRIKRGRYVGRVLAWLKQEKRILGMKGTHRLKQALRRWIVGNEDVAGGVLKHLRSAANDCDLVYVFWPHRHDFPRIDKPIVCTFQDPAVLEFDETRRRTESQAEIRKARAWLSGCSQVVFPSVAIKAVVERRFGEAFRSPAVINHFIAPKTRDERKPLVENGGRYKEAVARAMNEQRQTWDDVASQYVSVFRQALERAGGVNG